MWLIKINFYISATRYFIFSAGLKFYNNSEQIMAYLAFNGGFNRLFFLTSEVYIQTSELEALNLRSYRDAS